MVREAEEFATEDEAQRKRIESLNSLQNYVWASSHKFPMLRVSAASSPMTTRKLSWLLSRGRLNGLEQWPDHDGRGVG